MKYKNIKSPIGNELNCKGWQQEAAYRMLQNNLDPNVAENNNELIVYGGFGKAARDWDCYYKILDAFKYDSELAAGPTHTASSANLTWRLS